MEDEVNAVCRVKLMLSTPNLGEVGGGSKIGNFLIGKIKEILLILLKNTAKRNMSSAVCASSIYSRLCMKMSSFLLVRACAMPRMLYISCGIPFPV